MESLSSILASITDNSQLLCICLTVFLLTSLLSESRIRYLKANNKTNFAIKILTLFLCALPLALLLGLRDISMGYDTARYINSYTNMADVSMSYAIEYYSYSYGPLYSAIAWIFSSIGGPIFCQYMITELSAMLLIAGFEKTDDIANSSWSIFIFLLYIGLNLADQTRQMFALSFGIYAFGALLDNRKITFAVLSIIELLIHPVSVSFVLLTILFFVLRDGKTRHSILLAILVVATVAIPEIITSLLTFVLQSTRYTTYISEQAIINTGTAINTGLGFIVALLPLVIPCVLYYNRINNKELYRGPLIACTSFGIPFRMFAYYANWLGRLFTYPLFFASIITSSVILIERDSTKKIDVFSLILCVGSVFVYFVITYVYANNHGFFPVFGSAQV